MMKKLSILAAVAVVAIGTGAGLWGTFASASATTTGMASANISSDSTTGASVALPALTITEGAAGDIAAGTLTWALPAGFVFDTSSTANASTTGTGLASGSSVSFPDSTHFSINITASSTSAGTLTIGSTTPLKVKASAGTPLASGNITLSSGTITGVSPSTNFGTLTEIPGAAAKLSFVTQPPSTATVNSAFSAQVGVQDQFGNTLTSDSSTTVMVSSNLVSGTAGTLGGTLSMIDTNGLANFANLTFDQPAVITLSTQSTGLTGATSTQISISSASSTAPTVPGNLTATSTSSSTVNLSWSASTDPNFSAGMLTYNIFRNGTMIATTTAGATAFTDTNLAASTTYSYTVSASDPANRTSAQSAAVSVTTLPSNTPPVIVTLANGTEVQLQGNPTIFIVKNGHLVPLNKKGGDDGMENEGKGDNDSDNGGTQGSQKTGSLTGSVIHAFQANAGALQFGHLKNNGKDK